MTQFDVILVSGEYFVDHPLSPVGVIKRVLESRGYSVGVIEKPDWKTGDDFVQYGLPKLFFGVVPGSIDSMLQNYTPLKKLRKEDEYEPYDSRIPDRAVIVYCNKLKELFKDSIIVIGGIESSMRRFTHFDYWDNNLRKSLLVDSRSDILVYGNGEYQVVEIAKRLREAKNNSAENVSTGKIIDKSVLFGIEGTCVISNEVPVEFEGRKFEVIPSFDEVKSDKLKFCEMQNAFANYKNLAQKQDTRYVLQFKSHEYTSSEIDAIYELGFTRNIPRHFPEFRVVQFSVVTHRGCIGDCNFCSLTLHQGNRIISRSKESIIRELVQITKHKEFKGYIDDLGGPSANMYGMDCKKCTNGNCLKCNNLDRSHKRIIELLRMARKVPGIKKIFIRSGVRYDLALDSVDYIKEISDHHISGSLKIAPEHFSNSVLTLMNKDNSRFNEFKRLFDKHNRPKGQVLKYYFMTAHPGSGLKEAEELKLAIKELKNTDSVQVFTPTPMTVSTCMYYTGLNPKTLEPVYIPYTYNEKKQQKNVLFANETVVKFNPNKYAFQNGSSSGNQNRSQNEYRDIFPKRESPNARKDVLGKKSGARFNKY